MEEKTSLDKKRGKTRRWSLNYDKINKFKEEGKLSDVQEVEK